MREKKKKKKKKKKSKGTWRRLLALVDETLDCASETALNLIFVFSSAYVKLLLFAYLFKSKIKKEYTSWRVADFSFKIVFEILSAIKRDS